MAFLDGPLGALETRRVDGNFQTAERNALIRCLCCGYFASSFIFRHLRARVLTCCASVPGAPDSAARHSRNQNTLTAEATEDAEKNNLTNLKLCYLYALRGEKFLLKKQEFTILQYR